MAYPNPPDTGPQPQPRAISSFSRPGSTIDDLMARFSSPNPNPAPPAISSPFSSGPHQHNGSATMMSPPPPPPGMGGYTTPSSMFSPAGGMPALHGGPSPAPMYGGAGSGGMPGMGMQSGAAGENRQSQLLDLLRSAGQSPVVGMPLSSSPAPPSNLYQQFGFGNGQPPLPPMQHQHSSYGQHHHPAMQQNSSFSGLPSTGVNRVVSPTQGLMSAAATAGTSQAQNLLAALINGSSTPVSPAPAVQEIPFSIHQPVIIDQQVPPPTTTKMAATEQSNGLARADTFGNLQAKHGLSEASSTGRQGSEKGLGSDVPPVEVEEPVQASTTASSDPAEMTTAVPTPAAADPVKPTAAFFSSFVSPFDAFDPPPPTTRTTMTTSTSANDASGMKKKSKKDKPAAGKVVEKLVVAEGKSSKVPAPRSVSENAEHKDKAAQASSEAQTVGSETASTLPSLSVKKTAKQEDIPVVYRSSAFIDPSRPTTAGTIPSAEWTYDMSQPHTESLVHIAAAEAAAGKPYEERRISNIKTHVMTTGLSSGSVLRASVNLLAYVLPKGKARVVNQDTAGNSLIALTDCNNDNVGAGSQQQPTVAVVDLALTDKWVVLLGEDGSFGVWRVDTGSDGQSMACQPEFFRGASSIVSAVKRVELVDVEGVVTLVLMTDEAVASVAVEEILKADEMDDWMQVMDVTYEGTRSGLVDLDISLERGEIAVATQSGEFCVYSLNKAQPIAQGTHRPTDGTWVTSVRILGENLLIGLSEGEFDLVAARDTSAGKAAPIISKLMFKDHTRSINPEQALWMKPRVNEKERLLWIVSFSRASVFAIKYRDVQNNGQAGGGGGGHRAFRKILEFPLEPLGDFTLDPSYSASFFFKDPKGFSQASVPKHLLDLLDESAEEDVDESDESAETAESVAAPAVEQDHSGPLLSKQDTDLEQSAKALDDNAAQAISQDVQASPEHEALTINKDLAANKPGSGMVDADEARQEPALHAQPSTANTNGNEDHGNTSSNVSALDLGALQSSIAEHVQQSMSSQLSSFSANQLGALHAIRHDLMAQDTERQQTLVTLVSDVIERDIRKNLQQIVSNQIDKKVVPLVVETLRQQTDKAFSSEIPAQINSALQDTVLSQVERSLIPHLGRTFTSTLSPIVERNVRTLIADSLVPQFMESVDTISDELSAAIHREMLEVRKDVLVEQSTQLKSAEAMIQSMAASMKTLVGQVSDLSDQVKELKVLHSQAQAQAQLLSRGPPPPPPMHQPMPPPPAGFPMMPTPQTLPMAPHKPSFAQSPRHTGPGAPPVQAMVPDVPLPSARPDPSLAGAEEDFLNALMTMSDAELIGFVMARSDRTQMYLPAPGQQPCPLSQQVLLTMIHRLTKAMTPLPTATAEYQTLLRWIFRITYLIDGQQPDIRDFFEPVKRALTTDYQALIDRYAQQQDRSPATVQAVQTMVQIVQILASK